MSKTVVKIEGRTLTLSNLDKVFYPASGFRKAEVLDYYRRISPVLLPHVRGHPVTMKRYPEGVDDDFFYEKRCPPYRPDWLRTKRVPSAGPPLDYCVIDDQPSLIWIANLASIELHTLLYTTENIHRPTVMVFDLDPGPPAGLADCLPIALAMRDLLAEAGLRSCPKTSGGNGFHFYVPLNTPVTFDRTKAFARAVAGIMEQRFPDKVVSKMSKALRRGKVFVDWSQNDEHKTTVSVYSLRARERPTVSTPLTWDEVEGARRKGDAGRLVFEADAVLKRVDKRGDLFADVLTIEQALPGAPS